MDEQERAIRDYVESRRSKRIQQLSGTSNLIIPVVVYVIHDSGTALNVNENISDQQVNSQIAALNNAFSGQGVQFCLATKQGSTLFTGSTPGIIRIASGFTNHLTSQENQLKTLLPSLPGDRYLRIWVVKDIDNNSGVAGYARFPGTVPLAWEGIVMRYDVFGNKLDPNCNCPNLLANYDQGRILAHEVGHYLYLYHPFHGGCSGNLPVNCATAGDRVCDTPQVAVANTGCPASAPSCSTASALINNEMDYTNDLCRNAFTTDQQGRMLATINTLRPVLISAQNLVYTGVQCAGGVNASFSADNYNPCSNQTAQFNGLIIAGANYAWDFGDGSTATGNPVSHSYIVPGTYTVTLTVTSGSNSVSSTQQIFVTACAPINSNQGNWYFGFLAGLNFSSGSPVPALGAFNNNTISTNEGSISQSDPSGNLLFYSDGVKVWDTNHTLINPMTPLTGHTSGSQTALSVPVPGNPNRYYLFTIPTAFNSSSPFAYSIVDVTGGNASLVTANIPITLPAGASHISEPGTAVQKCNGDYWVIVRGYPTDPIPFRNSFYVYSVTSSSVTLAGTYPFAVPMHVGQLKMSPDGALLASSGGTAVICDFDRATGVLSNPRSFSKGDYGISFSPNSHVFYIADYTFTGMPYYQTLYQYDLLNPNPASTEQIVATTADLESSLQIGPDRKIYMSLRPKKNLAVINFPDNLVSIGNPNACGFSYNGPSLVTSSSQGISNGAGLPNMIDALPPSQIPSDFSYITSSCSTLNFSAPACASSYLWSFGDTTTANVQNPTHTYASNGTYTVTLTLNGTTTVTETVTIGIPTSAATIFGPAAVCLGGGNPPFYNYSTNAQPGWTYNWTVTGGTISGASNSDNIDVVWNTFPGTVQLTVADPLTGCSVTQSLSVTQGSISGTDLYMKDTMAPDLPEDFGVEPTVSQTLYISRDIWVRTTSDTHIGSTNPGPDTVLAADSYYANEHQHQDPTYIDATTPSYVYVKLRNRGCTSSTGAEKLRVYWADASTNLPWPGTNIWNEFDCASGGGIDPCPLPVMAPGQDYVLELPWVPPDPASLGGNDHFCLVARIETAPTQPFGMTNDESLNQWLWQNVAGNNNIAWKNLTVFTGSGKGKVIVRNTLRQETVLTLRFAVPQRELKNHFLLHGDIIVDLGDALMKKWRQGKQRPQGFAVVGRTTIKITDPGNAILSGLVFRPGEEQTIEVRMQLKPSNNARPGTSFSWDVIQMAPLSENAKPTPIGGERYIFVVPQPEKCVTAITLNPAAGALPAPVINTPYRQTFTATGGCAPSFTYSLTSGTLPNGLRLGADGVLSGTATQRGTYDFTVTATDSCGCTQSHTYTLTANVRRGEFNFTRGMNEFCIWGGGGGSYNSPTQIDNPYAGTPFVNTGGNNNGVRFGSIGLCYGRILAANDRFAFKYTFNAIPVAVLSYPDNNRDLGIPVPGSETRRNVFGWGLSPIGFQLYFRPQSRVKPFVSTSGGFIFFGDPVPRLNGARFNFTYDFGAGVQVVRDSQRAFNFGYKYQRISNGGRALNNPGFDGNVFYFGYSIFKGKKIAQSSRPD